jgi:hypothetical protein
MAKRFVSEPITPCHGEVSNTCHGEVSNHPELAEGIGREPALPAAFRWRDQRIAVKRTLRRRRSTKVDRGDTYLKRHWFDVETDDGRIATVYYDRAAKRGQPHWWLYSIED